VAKEELMKEELIEELNELNLKKLNERDIEQKIYEIETITVGSKSPMAD